MSIRWLVIFAEVAAEGSFIRAATRLNVAQPWLSAQVHRLEEQYGVKLFERLSTGLELTTEGRALLPYAQEVAEGSRKFREAARTMGDVRNKTVRIGSCFPMLQIPVLHKLNGSFATRYSQFSIVAESHPLEDMLQRLAEGQLDIIAALTPIPQLDFQKLEVIDLEPATPFILARRRRSMGTTNPLSGLTVAIPPDASHPGLMNSLVGKLKEAGADLRKAPEPDQQALVHYARTHGVAVLMLQGQPDQFYSDPDLEAILVPGVESHHVLLRDAARPLARAAEHYWVDAKHKPE